MRLRCLAFALVATIILLLAPSWASADPITLDQNRSYSQPGETLHSGSFYANYLRAQTYTAGLDGILAGVTIGAWEWSGSQTPITVAIYSVTGGVPTSNVLGSVTLPLLTPTFSTTNYYVDFLAFAIAQSAGTQYAIVLSASDNSGAWGYGRLMEFVNYSSLGDTYAGGQMFYNQGYGWNSGYPEADYYFQTYVDQGASVPEPASLLLLGTGLVGLVGAARRRMKK